jgi:predicted transcriptional regulator
MLPNNIMGKTVQLGLRIDADLNEEIEYLAQNEGVDKMAWIRRALADFASQERDSMAKEAVKDFIYLAIDDKTLLEFANFDKIPKDILDARAEMLKKIKEDKE